MRHRHLVDTQKFAHHYMDIIMDVIASQITSLTSAYSAVHSGVDKKKNIKAPRHRLLCGEFTGNQWIPAQMASNAENVSIWWRHDVMESYRVSFVSSKSEQSLTFEVFVLSATSYYIKLRLFDCL